MNYKIWMFIIEKQLSEDAIKSIAFECNEFLKNWKSHEEPLKADFELYKNRILIFRNNEDFNHISGCATDKLFHFIQSLEKKYQTSLLNRQLVVYENNNVIDVCPLEKVEELMQANIINSNTLIYNTAITHSSEMKNFAQAFNESWLQHVLQ